MIQNENAELEEVIKKARNGDKDSLIKLTNNFLQKEEELYSECLGILNDIEDDESIMLLAHHYEDRARDIYDLLSDCKNNLIKADSYVEKLKFAYNDKETIDFLISKAEKLVYESCAENIEKFALSIKPYGKESYLRWLKKASDKGSRKAKLRLEILELQKLEKSEDNFKNITRKVIALTFDVDESKVTDDAVIKSFAKNPYDILDLINDAAEILKVSISDDCIEPFKNHPDESDPKYKFETVSDFINICTKHYK